MKKTNSASPKQRAKPSHIDELQPLSWDILSIPEALRFVYALRLPPHWVDAIKRLTPVDEIPPVISLHTALRVLAPEILYFFPSSFAENPQRRPAYWLLADAQGAELSTERFIWAIRAWLNVCYGNEVIRAVADQFQPSDLCWERLDLQDTLSDDVIMNAFPGLIARWLLTKSFPLSFFNAAKQEISYALRLAPSQGPDVDLISWPPTSKTIGKDKQYYYSYYLKFRLSSLPGKEHFRLLCQPGIRRWVTLPLAKTYDSGKTYIDLEWKREKSVFIARNSASWLTQQPTTTSLIRLGLRRYKKLVWVGRLSEILYNLSSQESIPDPLELLTKPDHFFPGMLIVHDNLLSTRHIVGAGIEEIDRWDVFRQLAKALPEGLISSPVLKKLRGFQRSLPSSAAQLSSKAASPAAYLHGVHHMRVPALIEICSTDAKHVEDVLLQQLGVERAKLVDGHILIQTNTGMVSALKVAKRLFPSELIGELPAAAGEDEESRFGATRALVRKIQKELEAATENTGVLLELPNYQTFYKDKKQKRRDPKLGIMWGFARQNRKLQTFQPKQLDEESYEERIQNAVRDVLRQMDFHFSPLYGGFRGTSLPQDLDIVAFWQVRLKARSRGESATTLPILVHAPAHEYGLSACIPGAYGPLWCSYPEMLVTIPDFSGGYENPEAIRTFFQRALEDRYLSNATLLLISEQNARSAFPEITDDRLQATPTGLRCALSFGDIPCRIARLRYSGYGMVPLVCPTHSFGRFSGLFHDEHISHVFYSLQERPLSAQRPQALHQRDSQSKPSWNPSTVEIALLNMHREDSEHEWAWLVHRLRQESSHTQIATLLPEPLYAASKVEEYVLRINDESGQ